MMLRRTIAIALAIGLSSTTALAEDGDDEEARVHFSAGVNLLRDPARPHYEEAYAEFKKAYQLAASPKILGNMGLCAMKLERDAEAIDAYTRYLAEVPDMSAEERAQIERDVSTLKATLAIVSIETRPPGASIIDTRIPTQGEPITNAHGPIHTRSEIGLRRGHHVIKARFDGARELVWEADINGGESHVFEAPASITSTPDASTPDAGDRPHTGPTQPSRSRPIPTSVYVAGGVTLGLGVATLVTGLVAVDTRSKFDASNDGRDPARADDLRGTGEALNIATDVLLIGTLVGAGVTTYLFLTRPRHTSSTTLSSGPRGLRVWF